MGFEKSENPFVRRRKSQIAIFLKLNRTATIVSGIAILLVLCIVAIQYSAAKRKSDLFQSAIADIDSDLQFRRYPAAQEQIDELLPLAGNKREMLGLLKRERSSIHRLVQLDALRQYRESGEIDAH